MGSGGAYPEQTGAVPLYCEQTTLDINRKFIQSKQIILTLKLISTSYTSTLRKISRIAKGERFLQPEQQIIQYDENRDINLNKQESMAGKHQENSRTKVRVLAILLLCLEICIGFVYGFKTQFDIGTANYPTTSDNSSAVILYILSAVLAILGWGLIIAYSQNSAVSGLMTTLITVGIFVQLGPLLKHFWDNVFHGTWPSRLDVGILLQSQVMFSVTSMMITLCFLSGRLGLVETVWTNVVFCVGWNANFSLIYWLKATKFAGEIQNSDSVGGNSVYLFAGVVGLIASFFLSLKKGNQGRNTGSRQSALIALMGTGFAFAAAPFSGLQSVTLSGTYEFPLNVYFALTGSVVSTYIFSAIFGDYRVGIRQSIVGVLGGVAMMASVASYINNIGGCLAIGIGAGFVSGLWLRVVHPKLNQNSKYDQLGLIGPVLINSFLGCLIVAPLLFEAYKNIGITPNELTMPIKNNRASIYYLSIFGITLGVAILTGLIIGVVACLLRDPEDDFHYVKIVSHDFGLFNEPRRKEDRVIQENGPSAQNLHNSRTPGML